MWEIQFIPPFTGSWGESSRKFFYKNESQPYQDDSEMIDGAFKESEVPLRRSNRIRKPVERHNL